MSKPTKDYVPFSMKIERNVNDRFRHYAEMMGQSYTTCLERMITEFLNDKGFEVPVSNEVKE